MGFPVRRLATYADVLAAPEGQIAELLDGELHLSPRPALAHAVAASALGEELGPPFKRGRGGPGGWMILDEPELHLGADVLVPDLAGWRTERLPAIPTELAYLELATDWICEVLSAGTRKTDRTLKVPKYAASGVHHVWIVDPVDRTLEVLRLVQDGKYLVDGLYADEAKVRAPPFDAIELDLSILWAGTTP